MVNIDGVSSELKKKSLLYKDLPDCIHLNERGKCRFLKTENCLGSKCSFATTRQNIAEKEMLCAERLCSLPAEKQIKISKKYYDGKMPWKKGDERSV